MNDIATQRQITAFWDAVASQYDASAHKNVAPADSRDYVGWVEAVRPLMPAHPSDILDVGTGTGFLAGIADREPGLFERYYNHETQAELPAMRLADHAPLLEIATAAGFHNVTISTLDVLRGWETSPGSDVPSAIVCYRSPNA